MEYILLGIIIFLFILAIFDLSAGVNNDASNFLTSAIGAKAASFRVIVAIAAMGILAGALSSNGMIDVVRNGLFRPEHFTFYEVICICMAVMVADVILLEIFNTLGMPTSTTVSMVFEILGAAFAVSIFKIHDQDELSLGQLLNTEKAFEVIVAIFLSVGIAFLFGTLVQYLSRLWFSFDYKKNLKWKIGIFGGLCCTAIVYFMLIKGLSGTSLVSAAHKEWINTHTLLIVCLCFAVFAIVMQGMHLLGVNVLRVIVLLGTFPPTPRYAHSLPTLRILSVGVRVCRRE